MVEELKYRAEGNVTNVRLVSFETITGIKNEFDIACVRYVKWHI